MSNQVELYGSIVRVTDKAILWTFEGEEIWLPRSQTDFGGAEEPNLEEGHDHTIWIPEWLAEEKGLDV